MTDKHYRHLPMMNKAGVIIGLLDVTQLVQVWHVSKVIIIAIQIVLS